MSSFNSIRKPYYMAPDTAPMRYDTYSTARLLPESYGKDKLDASMKNKYINTVDTGNVSNIYHGNSRLISHNDRNYKYV